MKPVPVTGIDCVGMYALSVTTTVPVLVPACEGVKTTPKVHVPFRGDLSSAASVIGHGIAGRRRDAGHAK